MGKIKSKPDRTSATIKWQHLKPTPLISGSVIVTCIGVVSLLWRLVSITSGRVSLAELATKHQLLINSPWWKSLAGLYGPYYLLLHGLYAVHNSIYFFRLASIFPAIINALLIYWLVAKWHGYKMGLLSAILFITNFSVLVISRQASPLSSELLPIGMLLGIIIIVSEWDDLWTLLALIIVFAGCLYVPGALWLVVLTTVLTYTLVKDAYLSQNLTTKISLVAMQILLIAPLIYRLAWHYSNTQLLLWLGRPHYPTHRYFSND